MLKFNINMSVDPCDDFYKFACGGYLNKTKLEGSLFRNYYTTLEEDIQRIMNGLLQQPMKQDDSLPSKLVKTIYSSCNNQERIDATSIKSLKKIFDELGGFPLFSESWNETDFHLSRYLIKLRSKGFNQHTLVSIKVDGSQEKGYQFEFQKTDFADRRSMLLKGRNTSRVDAYFDYMNKTMVALGGNSSLIKDELEDIIAFEIKLAELASSDSDDEYLSLRDLDVEIPDFPWIQYFKDSFSPYYNFTLDESVVLEYNTYYRGLSNLTKSTKNRTLCNFILWRFIDFFTSAMPTQIQNIKSQFLKKTTGMVDHATRNQTCLSMIQENFKAEVGYMFVLSFNKTHIEHAREIAEEIRKTYLETLINATWMENNTRQEAIKKVQEMVFHISYPSFLDNITLIEEYYADLPLRNESYLQSLLDIEVFKHNKNMKERFERMNVNLKFLEDVPRLHGYYRRRDNSMGAPASILREIFFAYNTTKYLNFGGIGSVISNKIAHGFDNEGRHHDSSGFVRNWWDNITEKIYEKRSECFVKQYGKLPLLSDFVDGEKTLDGNMDDNVGVKMVYLAYQRWIKNYKPEKRLPGLNFNPKQLFWMQYGATMCEKMSDYYEEYTLSRLHTSPPEYRVNIVLGNIDYFRQDWNCSAKSKMVLNETCYIW